LESVEEMDIEQESINNYININSNEIETTIKSPNKEKPNIRWIHN
jgi:hypothetical protein